GVRYGFRDILLLGGIRSGSRPAEQEPCGAYDGVDERALCRVIVLDKLHRSKLVRLRPFRQALWVRPGSEDGCEARTGIPSYRCTRDRSRCPRDRREERPLANGQPSLLRMGAPAIIARNDRMIAINSERAQYLQSITIVGPGSDGSHATETK